MYSFYEIMYSLWNRLFNHYSRLYNNYIRYHNVIYVDYGFTLVDNSSLYEMTAYLSKLIRIRIKLYFINMRTSS